MNLTTEQHLAVDCEENLLLTACPGSGKTRTIIAKLVKEVEKLRGSPRAVACITYTNTAVHEIEHRSASLLNYGDEINYSVSTIHAFCLNNILRPFAWRLAGFRKLPKILSRDNPDFESIAQYAASQIGWYNLRANDYEAFEGLNIDTLGQITGTADKSDMLKRAAPYFWQRCDELGYIDFCNILYRSFLLLRDFPEIAHSLSAKYAYILIDEFQDTTDLQIEILKLIYLQEKSYFFAVGDLSQSIFGFAGAKPELVTPFSNFINARSDISLSGNYRSNPQIVAQAELLFPRIPPMISVGKNRTCTQVPMITTYADPFQAIIEQFLPKLAELGIPLGEACILANSWVTFLPISRQLREYNVPVVGPGARPYKRARLFAQLAEQLCGAVIDPQPDSIYALERATFNAIQDITANPRTDIFSFEGRVTIMLLLQEAKRFAEATLGGAIAWLDSMSAATDNILLKRGFIGVAQSGLFFSSAQEMKADMERNNVNIYELSIEDLGLFASPHKALRLTTIHQSKGREYDAVAILGLRKDNIPHYYSQTAQAIEADKRLFYVAVTRARRLLFYIHELDSFRKPPSVFLGPSGVKMLDINGRPNAT